MRITYRKTIRKLLGKLNIAAALVTVVALTATAGIGTHVLASGTSVFGQTINAGSLSTDIVDSGYTTVGSPTVTMGAVTFSFTCQTATGTFGAAEQLIYIQNPDASDTGWTLDLAGSATTAYWDSAGTDFDFNDNTGSGCTDGADTDSLGGQMTVDPSVATLAVGQCNSCAVTNVTKGTSSAFLEGTTDSINLLTGAAASDDIGDWKLTGVSISQKIPLEQAAASDYTISMVLSVTAT